MATFFEQQDDARRRTALLLAGFTLGVLFVVCVVWLSVEILFHWTLTTNHPAGEAPPVRLHVRLFLGTLATVGGTISLASWFHIRNLASGGSSVALQLGGRNIDPSTQDPSERRLVNVVEEMAIASGLPVPQIFVLDHETSINAFAAGYTSDDAAVAVTRGALELFNRDEMQGVIAHEFSHILNGDMRLNIRAAGVLHGLSVLSEIGLFLIWGMARNTSQSREAKQAGGAIQILGVAIFVAGYIGLLTGRVLRAAISRQREFLADASAAQFTRNPAGLASALQKIGAMQAAGVWMHNAFAEEYSHLFFSSVKSHWILGSHPPLAQRIRRLARNWDGSWPDLQDEIARLRQLRERAQAARAPPSALGSVLTDHGAAAPLAAVGAAVGAAAGAASFAGPASALGPSPSRPTAEPAFAPPSEHAAAPAQGDNPLDAAVALLASVPDTLRDAVHTPEGAIALPLLLLIDHDPALADRALSLTAERIPDHVFAELTRLRPALQQLPSLAQVPLLRLAAPQLRALPTNVGESLLLLLFDLARLDDHWSLFELAVYRCVLGWVHARTAEASVFAIRPALGSIATVLSATAWAGHNDDPALAYARGAGLFRELRTDDRSIGAPVRSADQVTGFAPRESLSGVEIDGAIEQLMICAPLIRGRVVEAVRQVILADEIVHPSEAVLYAVLLEALGEPANTQRLAPGVRRAASDPGGP